MADCVSVLDCGETLVMYVMATTLPLWRLMRRATLVLGFALFVESADKRLNQHFLYGSLIFRGRQVSRFGGKLEVTVRAPTCQGRDSPSRPRQGGVRTAP